jgi:hypothetical protein
MAQSIQEALTVQFEASLAMLKGCIERCPDDQWDATIAKYPFWQVAYHTLCYVDLYLESSNDAWQPRTEADGGGLHPLGVKELENEYPSRRFERDELLGYVAICRQKARDVLLAETDASLAGPSGFDWLKFPRLEAHLYNLRHVMHHVGALSAFMHRIDVGTPWVKSGWK